MERLNNVTLNNLKMGSEIPNTPFLYSPSRDFVLSEAKGLGFRDTDEREGYLQNQELEYATDSLATYIHIKKGESPTRTIITTHLDHPFIVLDGKGRGQALGTIGSERLKKLASEGGIPLRVFSSEGEYQTNDVVKSVKGEGGRVMVATDGRNTYTRNSHGVWDLEPFLDEGETLKMINADNVVSSALLLTLMKELSDYHGDRPIDVEFIFSHLEEVRQISATGIARRGRTPFGDINSKTNIFILESASVNSPKAQFQIMEDLNLAPANYNDGVVLRVNDGGVLYGQNGRGVNRAENLMLHGASATDIKYQQTLLDGVCEGTPYTIFSDTPSIACINVPTLNKHNWGENGEIVQEVVRKSDVQDALDLTRYIVMNSSLSEQLPLDQRMLTPKLVNTQVVANPYAVRDLKSDRESAYYANSYRLSQRIFYPRQVQDRFYMFLGSVMRRMTASTV